MYWKVPHELLGLLSSYLRYDGAFSESLLSDSLPIRICKPSTDMLGISHYGGEQIGQKP